MTLPPTIINISLAHWVLLDVFAAFTAPAHLHIPGSIHPFLKATVVFSLTSSDDRLMGGPRPTLGIGHLVCMPGWPVSSQTARAVMGAVQCRPPEAVSPVASRGGAGALPRGYWRASQSGSQSSLLRTHLCDMPFRPCRLVYGQVNATDLQLL